jgi:hypothetical protein
MEGEYMCEAKLGSGSPVYGRVNLKIVGESLQFARFIVSFQNWHRCGKLNNVCFRNSQIFIFWKNTFFDTDTGLIVNHMVVIVICLMWKLAKV